MSELAAPLAIAADPLELCVTALKSGTVELIAWLTAGGSDAGIGVPTVSVPLR